jgi:hypothetical protein
MSKMPAKKVIPAKGGASPAKKPTSNAAKPTQKVEATKTANGAGAAAVVRPEPKIVKEVKMKEVVPKQMEKLENLKQWPIIMDEVGE